MEPVGALGDIFRARTSRWRNLAAGGIMPSRRPAGGLIAKLLDEIAWKSHIFLRKKGMAACACSRVRLIGARRPLELAGSVTTAVCGFSKLAENFFKKVLDELHWVVYYNEVLCDSS